MSPEDIMKKSQEFIKQIYADKGEKDKPTIDPKLYLEDLDDQEDILDDGDEMELTTDPETLLTYKTVKVIRKVCK